MRTNRFGLTLIPTWTLLVLWMVGTVLSAVPERNAAVDGFSPVFQQGATFEGIEVMPVLVTQDWRQSVSVRVDTSSSHPKHHDLKKFHAALANPAFMLAAPSPLLSRHGFSQPVPESWYGFSFSSRSPPAAA